MSRTPPGEGSSTVRDHLANERTFLAWVRTSVTFVGLGFAVDRLAIGDQLGQLFGLVLIAIGGALMAPALFGYRRTARAIAVGGYSPSVVTSSALAVVVMLGAAALLLYTLIGPR